MRDRQMPQEVRGGARRWDVGRHRRGESARRERRRTGRRRRLQRRLRQRLRPSGDDELRVLHGAARLRLHVLFDAGLELRQRLHPENGSLERVRHLLGRCHQLRCEELPHRMHRPLEPHVHGLHDGALRSRLPCVLGHVRSIRCTTPRHDSAKKRRSDSPFFRRLMTPRITLLLGALAVACSAGSCGSSQSGPPDVGTRATGGGGSTPGTAGSAGSGSGATGGGGTGGSSRPGPDGGEIDATGPDAVDVASDARSEAADGAPNDGDAKPHPPPFIVVVGSSTAAGFGLADPSTSWVQRYATYLATAAPGSKVTNLAVSGYTTYEVQPTGTMNPTGRPAVDP